MTTRTKTVVRRQEWETDRWQMRVEGEQLSLLPRRSGQRTFQRGFPKSRCGNPLDYISAAEDPSAECGGEGSVARFQTWQYPEFPEHGFQKRSLEDRRSFDIFPRRVGPGTWYPHHSPVLVVLELALHQNSEVMESGTSVPTHLVNVQTSSGDS